VTDYLDIDIDDDEQDGGDDQVVLSRSQLNDLQAKARRAKKAEESASEAAVLKREVAFLKAGITTEKGVGALLYKAYDGDLTVDAIKSAAAEYGIGDAPVIDAPEVPETEQTATTERQNLAAGAEADVPPVPDAIAEAKKVTMAAFEKGASEEEALAQGFMALAQHGEWRPV
jgi:hypothetical protein